MSRCRKADKNEIEPLKSVSQIKKRIKITKKDIGQMMTIEEPRRKKKKPHDHFPMPATAKKRKTKKKKKKKDRPVDRHESPTSRAQVLPTIVARKLKPSPTQPKRELLTGTLSPTLLPCPSPTPLSATLDDGAARRLLDTLEENDRKRRIKRIR